MLEHFVPWSAITPSLLGRVLIRRSFIQESMTIPSEMNSLILTKIPRRKHTGSVLSWQSTPTRLPSAEVAHKNKCDYAK